MFIMEFDIQVDREGIVRKCTQCPVSDPRKRAVTASAAETAPKAVAVPKTVVAQKRKLSIAERLFIRINSIPHYKLCGTALALLGVSMMLSGIGDAGLMMMALGVGVAFSPIMEQIAQNEKSAEKYDENPTAFIAEETTH